MLCLLATKIGLGFQMSFESDVSIPVLGHFFSIIQIEAININRLQPMTSQHMMCLIYFVFYFCTCNSL